MKISKQTRYHAATRYQTFDEKVFKICGIVIQPAAEARIEWKRMTWTFSGGEVSDFRIMSPMPQGESSYFGAQREAG